MNSYNYLGQERSIDLSQTFSVLMRNVYTWMAAGLLMTAFTALIIAEKKQLLITIATNPALMW